jgi:hypothetical protein
MMALPDYATATIPHAGSSQVVESQSAATFSKRVWELHHIIANPRSRAIQVKSARRRLLRELANSKLI